MPSSLELTFRDMEPSAAIEQVIRERVERLQKLSPDIVSCRVVVEAPHQHHHQGNLFHVSVEVHLPGHTIAVTRDPKRHRAHEDAYVAIRDAFDAAKRRVQDYTRRRRGKTKHHEAPPHGVVTQLFPEEGYGRIATPDDRQVYFHKNSLVGASFEELEVGMPVSFVEEMGERGPQASTVKRVGKHPPVD